LSFITELLGLLLEKLYLEALSIWLLRVGVEVHLNTAVAVQVVDIELELGS
jgi:hypothetical protein